MSWVKRSLVSSVKGFLVCNAWRVGYRLRTVKASVAFASAVKAWKPVKQDSALKERVSCTLCDLVGMSVSSAPALECFYNKIHICFYFTKPLYTHSSSRSGRPRKKSKVRGHAASGNVEQECYRTVQYSHLAWLHRRNSSGGQTGLRGYDVPCRRLWKVRWLIDMHSLNPEGKHGCIPAYLMQFSSLLKRCFAKQLSGCSERTDCTDCAFTVVLWFCL